MIAAPPRAVAESPAPAPQVKPVLAVEPVTPLPSKPKEPEARTTALAPAIGSEATAEQQDKLQELERQLALERALRRDTEGERIVPPPGLDPRFRDEKLLLETFNRALKGAGFPGQVTNIDCTEHPCIVYGTGFGERGDTDKIKSALGPYQDDNLPTYGFGTGDGKREHRFFGVAVLPASKKGQDDATRKRISYRVNQMYEVSKPARSEPKAP